MRRTDHGRGRKRVEFLGQTALCESECVPKGGALRTEAVCVVFSFQYYKQLSLEAGKACSGRADQFLCVTSVFRQFFINDDERDLLFLTLTAVELYSPLMTMSVRCSELCRPFISQLSLSLFPFPRDRPTRLN